MKNTRANYSKIRMKKKPIKKVPQWILDRVIAEAEAIAKMYKSL